MNNMLLIMRNKAKLEKMIREGEPYNKILRQSQRLDEYINKQMIVNYAKEKAIQ